MIDVLIADDQALIRTGFRMILESTPDLRVVGEAEDGLQAIRLSERLHPDVVIMDVRMPRMNGIDATRRLAHSTRVLILTTFDLDEYAFEGLRAGASGFLLKDTPPQALFDAIRAVAAGDAVVSPRVTANLVRHFVEAPAAPPAADAVSELTVREREVFDSIVDGDSNAEIAAKMHLAEPTVKTHISRILTKLDLRDRVHVVIFAYENRLR